MKIRVIVCRVGQPPSVEEMENTGEAIREAVGGDFEHWGLYDGVGVYCYEWGRTERPFNRMVGTLDLFGDFIISRYDTEEDDVSLTDNDLKLCLPRLQGFTPSTTDGQHRKNPTTN